MSDLWSIVEDSFQGRYARAYEGLFTQGSGYLHVRGSLEEHIGGSPQNYTFTRKPVNVTAEKFPETKAKWGTYVPGVFGRHPLLNMEMVNLPFFADLTPVVAGEKLDMEDSRVSSYRRELELKTALLKRSLVWQTRSGAKIEVRFERFISAARTSLCVQRMTLKADRDITVAVSGGIDADVRTSGYDHFTSISLSASGPSGAACVVKTDNEEQVGIVTQLTTAGAAWKYTQDARAARISADIALRAGAAVTVEKRSAVSTSRDPNPTCPTECLAAAAGLSWEQLLAEHAVVWATRWENSDVVIEGDEASQLAMRVSIYHLLRTHVHGDNRVATDAKGYAGDAYFGRFFWDTEMYLLPFFLYTDPPAARTLVDFRVQSLNGARDNARRYYYPGARYPWESDNTGRESCPSWQYADHEVHVTADVVYGMAHYARGADLGYVRGPAAEVIVETCRYWLARMDWRKGQDHPSLLGVMGPDEYCPVSHNNAYTNRVVKHALALAAEVGDAGGATAAEREAFAEAAAKLPILRKGKLVIQCEDFELLAEPHFETTWPDRTKQFAMAVAQERLYRTKCLKQADVLMMLMLFENEFTLDEMRTAWDYYVPVTTHDSSLSAGVHAIMAAKLGLADEAWSFWKKTSGMDLDVDHGGAAEGIHIAGAGSNWMVAVLGFAGLATAMTAETLTLRPRLPKAWTRLAFPIIWQGCPVSIDLDARGARITNRGDKPLDVKVNDKLAQIAPGKSETF